MTRHKTSSHSLPVWSVVSRASVRQALQASSLSAAAASLCAACLSVYLSSPSTCGSVSESLSWQPATALPAVGFLPRFSLCRAVRPDEGTSCLPAGALYCFVFLNADLAPACSVQAGRGRLPCWGRSWEECRQEKLCCWEFGRKHDWIKLTSCRQGEWSTTHWIIDTWSIVSVSITAFKHLVPASSDMRVNWASLAFQLFVKHKKKESCRKLIRFTHFYHL